jgi:chemotaxis signal transduction protein
MPADVSPEQDPDKDLLPGDLARSSLRPTVSADPTGTEGHADPSLDQPVSLPRPIPAITWRDDGWDWLLPAALVLEVLRCDAPLPLLPPTREAGAGTPPGVLGTIVWRGNRIALVDLGAARRAVLPAARRSVPADGKRLRLRALVCPALGTDAGIEVFALAARGNPRVDTIREGEISPEPGDCGQALGHGAEAMTSARLRFRDQPFSVPDLPAVERLLEPFRAQLGSTYKE